MKIIPFEFAGVVINSFKRKLKGAEERDKVVKYKDWAGDSNKLKDEAEKKKVD